MLNEWNVTYAKHQIRVVKTSTGCARLYVDGELLDTTNDLYASERQEREALLAEWKTVSKATVPVDWNNEVLREQIQARTTGLSQVTVSTEGASFEMDLKPEWMYSDPEGFTQTIESYVKNSANGFYLRESDPNIAALASFVDIELQGYANTARVAVQELSRAGKLEIDDRRRRLKNGQLALDKDADEPTLRSATAEQLRDVLKASKPKQQEHLQPWDLPLLFVAEGGTLTKQQFIDAEPRALRSWITRRRVQGLGTAFVE
jgi:hypothetical protein